MKSNTEIKPLKSTIASGDGFTAPMRVILNPSHHHGEWVTHVQNMQDESKHWGHYFDDYEEAVEDFKERCARYNLKPEDDSLHTAAPDLLEALEYTNIILTSINNAMNSALTWDDLPTLVRQKITFTSNQLEKLLVKNRAAIDKAKGVK